MRPLAALAFVSIAMLSAPPALAQCRNGWCRVTCNNSGVCRYVKIIRDNYPQVFYKVRQSNSNLEGGLTYEADCIKDRNRAIISKDVILDWFELCLEPMVQLLGL